MDIITDKVTLLYGDCLERMAEIPDNSADITFTSPPYNMNLRVRNGSYCSRQIVKEISTKYANFDDNLPMGEYFEFSKKVVNECLRISPIVFYNVQFLTGNKRALFRLIGEFEDQLKEIIVWDKVNGQPAIQSGVMNSQYEVILVFDKNDAIVRQFKNANFNRGTLSNLWSIKRGRKIDKSHGAVFPVELAEKVISSFTNVGDAVFDPFTGTGTTGVACVNTGRKFIGIELDPTYYGIACNRILTTAT